MSTSYPYDYHPLAPLVRQLRGTIKWLDQSGVHLQKEQIHALQQRVKQLSNTPLKDQRTLNISRYWSSLPYEVSQVEINRVDALESATPTHYQPLPASHFPAVLHQHSVIESISFERAPPSDKDDEGSALLMEPSEALLQHKGMAFVTKEESYSVPVHIEPQTNKTPNAAISTKPKTEHLWATKPALQPISNDLSPQKHEAFTKLTITQSKAKSKVNTQVPNQQPDSLKVIMQPLSHVRKTTFESDEIFGEICDRIWGCSACPRYEAQHIIGTGHYGSQVMFVVAQPSTQDLKVTQLFMEQKERELFNSLLKAMSLSRMEIYLTSLLKCGSTVPQPFEWAHCQNHFLDELQVVRPKTIVALGYMASVMLLGEQVRQGVWGRYEEIDVMPTFHPEDILKGGMTLKKNFWSHLRLVMRKVGLTSPTL